jgi:hypothetical protein
MMQHLFSKFHGYSVDQVISAFTETVGSQQCSQEPATGEHHLVSLKPVYPLTPKSTSSPFCKENKHFLMKNSVNTSWKT